ncbi:MAG: PAS domain S-box-containing protein [Myxococcota bacterium]
MTRLDPALIPLARRTLLALGTLFVILVGLLVLESIAHRSRTLERRSLAAAQRLRIAVERAGLAAQLAASERPITAASRVRLDRRATTLAGAIEGLSPARVAAALKPTVADAMSELAPSLNAMLANLRAGTPEIATAVFGRAVDAKTGGQLDRLVDTLAWHLHQEAERERVILIILLAFSLAVLVLLGSFVLLPAARRARAHLSVRGTLHRVAVLVTGGHSRRETVERVAGEILRHTGWATACAPGPASLDRVLSGRLDSSGARSESPLQAAIIAAGVDGIPVLAQALDEGIFRRIQPLPTDLPWTELAQKHGLNAALVLPMGTSPAPQALVFLADNIEVDSLTANLLEKCADQLTAVLDREAARRADAHLAAVVSSSAEAVVTVHSTGVVLTWNPAAARLTGRTAEQAVGLDIARALGADDPALLQTLVASIDVDGAPVKGSELTLTDGAGAQRIIWVSGSAIDTADNRSVALIARDITEQRLIQRRIAETTAELKRSNTELEQFAYVVSHDLKAPLRAIDNLSQWIQEDIGDALDEETEQRLTLLRSRVKRMENLLNSLLQYSRAGRAGAEPKRVKLNNMLDEIRELLAPQPGFAVIAEGPMPWVTVVRAPLQQVLLNLVSNGLKHHDREEGEVRVSCRDDDTHWVFRVVDDGPGIPARFHERVFEIFQTLQSRDRVEGSGMGLAIVAKVVETFGGSISLESDGVRGTTFEFTWAKGSQP